LIYLPDPNADNVELQQSQILQRTIQARNDMMKTKRMEIKRIAAFS